MSHKCIKDVCSKLRLAIRLDISLSGDVVLLAGGSSSNTENSLPIICALTFDQILKEITCLEMKTKAMKNIFCMQRVDQSEILLLGGFQVISIV